jgi:glycerol-3-phosphate dehydrogenase
VKSAVGKGAVVANYVEGIGFLSDGSRIAGVKVKDLISGGMFDIRSNLVINAAGPWIDRVLNNAPTNVAENKFHHSLAMNIITDKFIDGFAVGIPSWPDAVRNGNDKKSHMLFVAPWKKYSIVGTFHSHYQGAPERFQVTEEKLKEILEEINSGYPGAKLDLNDIRFVHRGFLPEEESGGQAEVRLIRSARIFDHRLLDKVDGLISVMGVKFTSARQVAEETVNLVFKHFNRTAPACQTQFTRLDDGEIDNFSIYLEKAIDESKDCMDPHLVEGLVKNYGSDYRMIKQRIDLRERSEPLSLDSDEVLKAEIIHAVDMEMAIKLSDVVFRRTDLGSAGRPASTHLQFCSQVMGKALGWDKSRVNTELEAVESIYASLSI